MQIELKLSTETDAHIIKNMWPLYQHDVSEFSGQRTNQSAIFNHDEDVRDLEQHARSMEGWWKDPVHLFPYLIMANGKPAGFNLIAGRGRIPKTIDADFVVHEFFVLHEFRGSKVALQAATQGFQEHQGTWEVVTYPGYERGIAFWRKAVSNHDPEGGRGVEVDHAWGRKIAFTIGQ